MKTAYKNMINWISESKELRNDDNVEIGIKSIKLNNDQLNTLIV